METANYMVDRKLGTNRGYPLRILRLALLAVIFLAAGCASNPPDAGAEDELVEEDPGLAVDEETAETARVQSEGVRWTWHDVTERWRFVDEQKPELMMDGWAFEEDAIRLRLTAPAGLNLFRERPHSIVVKVLQLSDRQPFTDIRKTAAGLQKALADEPFDASVVAMESRVLHPGADLLLSLNRVANARFVAVVAGYFSLDGKTTTRLIPVPVIATQPESSGVLGALSFGVLGEEEVPLPRPARVKILLGLGAVSIESARVQAH